MVRKIQLGDYPLEGNSYCASYKDIREWRITTRVTIKDDVIKWPMLAIQSETWFNSQKICVNCQLSINWLSMSLISFVILAICHEGSQKSFNWINNQKVIACNDDMFDFIVNGNEYALVNSRSSTMNVEVIVPRLKAPTWTRSPEWLQMIIPTDAKEYLMEPSKLVWKSWWEVAPKQHHD